MKAPQKLLLQVGLLLCLLPVAGRADHIDDFKAAVVAQLPVGTDQDKVRQFLKGRNLFFTQAPQEKTITVRMIKKKGLFAETIVVTVFEFDGAGQMKAVRHTVVKE